jgi:hypothetical protein
MSFNELDPNDLEHDPTERSCRFVPYEEIHSLILDPSSYLRLGEAGVLIFIPDFVPGDPNHLKSFDCDSSLERIDFSALQR